jgi:Caspase domain
MAKRAAILIGVDKTGDLPRLKDAARGARLMQTWTDAQGIESVLLTDEAEPVTVEAIKKAIKKLADAANVSQLLVYFAGHGVALQRQEYWLLSDAPDDTQAAVNVATSAALAATCGIPHIVLVSDACRTAPEGIRAGSVRGSEIFPNREEDPKPVDQFFACQLGKPSHEVKDPAVTSAEFKALYTHELVPALLGRRQQIVEWSGDGAARVGHVHLRPLRDFLSQAVATRLEGLQMQSKVIQVPVAQISSDPPAWVSQVAAETTAGPGGLELAPPARPRAAPAHAPTPEALTAEMLRAAIAGGGAPGVTRGAPPAGIAGDVERLAQPFGPMHHETGCGFKLRGARAVQAVAAIKVEFAGGGIAAGDDLRVVNPARPGSNVLLVLDSGAGVLLPALPEFMCALSFEDGELVDVAYEPSDTTWRWGEFHARASEIRSLRAIASAALSRGSFKLEGDDALAIARRMQLAKGVDPSLAVYAAYAYHDLQRRDLLRQMADYMQGDLGAALFDVALLARKLDRRTLGRDAPPVLGAVPLMAQGWTLLRAFDVKLPPALAKLEGHRLPSLWTMFDAQGVERIRNAIAQGELK